MKALRFALFAASIASIASGAVRVEVHTVDELLAAQVALRTLPRDATWAGAEIDLAPGRYELPVAWDIAGVDAGTPSAPMVIAAPVGPALLVRAEYIAQGQWQPLTDAVFAARLPDVAQGSVWVADLTSAPPVGCMFFVGDNVQPESVWPEIPLTIASVIDTKSVTFSETLPANLSIGLIYGHLGGFVHYGWAYERSPLAALNGPTLSVTTKPVYGFAIGGHAQLYHLPEGMTRPGSWCLWGSRVYWWSPGGLPVNARITTGDQVVNFSTTHDIVLDGLSLFGGTGSAIKIDNCERITIRRCEVTGSGTAVQMIGGHDTQVATSRFAQLAGGGFIIDAGDRLTLTPSGDVVEGCTIEDYGLIWRTYRPAFQLSGVGTVIRGNLIRRSPHMGIMYQGNEHLIEGNTFDRLCQQVGDAGAIYGGFDSTWRGNRILGNKVSHIGTATVLSTAIYLDDQHSGDTVENNIISDTAYAIVIGGGRDNTVRNNTFINVIRGFLVDGRGLLNQAYHWGPTGALRLKLEAMPYQTPPWSERYPQLLTILTDEVGAPKGNVIQGNVQGGSYNTIKPEAAPYVSILP